MNALYSAIDELYDFVMNVTFTVLGMRRGQHFAYRPAPKVEVSDVTDVIPPIPEWVTNETDDLETLEEEAEEDVPQSFRSLDEILQETTHVSVSDIPQVEKNTIMYVGSTEAPVFKNPTREFDSRVSTLTYGDMVMVLDERGRYAAIALGEDRGWILREDLADRAAYVYPSFTIGEANNAEDPNTVRVRAIIDDMFGGGALELPLQSPEYIEYRLRRKGHRISWSEERPRIPGRWHRILKGQSGVKMAVNPKTGSVMEYMLSEDIGHLAYVESVFPDETIKLSEVGYPDSGIYNERVLTRDEWKELKPVFIQIV